MASGLGVAPDVAEPVSPDRGPETLAPTLVGPGRRTVADRLVRRVREQVFDPLDVMISAPIRRQRNAGREYRPIFVVGAMGSGTTLLSLSLWQRFHVAAAIRESVHQVSPRSFLFGASAGSFRSVREYEESILPDSSWSVGAGRAALLDLYRSCATGTSDVVIDKGPNANLVRAGFLAKCFPEAQFVLIFRDPVATVEGFRRKWNTFRRDSLEESIRFYAAIHQRFLRAAQEFPARVISVQYEALVEKYDDTITSLASALGLQPTTRRRALEAQPNVCGCGIRNVARGRIGIVADANRSAYERLSWSQIEKIRGALGPLHERLHSPSSPWAAMRPIRIGEGHARDEESGFRASPARTRRDDSLSGANPRLAYLPAGAGG